MHVLIVHAHPEPQSFTTSMLKTAVADLTAAGHSVALPAGQPVAVAATLGLVMGDTGVAGAVLFNDGMNPMLVAPYADNTALHLAATLGRGLTALTEITLDRQGNDEALAFEARVVADAAVPPGAN